MADLGTMTAPDLRDPAGPQRRIRRSRRLPGSRAVVGALLVTAAAVGVFAAYVDATGEPSTRYVVAQDELPIGTLLTSQLVRDTSLFALVPMDLPPEVAARAVPVDAPKGRLRIVLGGVGSYPLAGHLVFVGRSDNLADAEVLLKPTALHPGD
jgi:hypothetical protein